MYHVLIPGWLIVDKFWFILLDYESPEAGLHPGVLVFHTHWVLSTYLLNEWIQEKKKN